MDKHSIQINNDIKFKKNNDQDSLLRYLDRHIARLDRKILDLTYDHFVSSRHINDINKIKYQLNHWVLSSEKKELIVNKLIKKLDMTNQEIRTRNANVQAKLDGYKLKRKRIFIKLYQSLR